MLKCYAYLRPGGLLHHPLDTHIIILRTLASFLKEKLFVLYVLLNLEKVLWVKSLCAICCLFLLWNGLKSDCWKDVAIDALRKIQSGGIIKQMKSGIF